MLYSPNIHKIEEEKSLILFLIEKIRAHYSADERHNDFSLNGKVYRVHTPKEAVVMTDLHGDLKTLMDVIFYEDVIRKLFLEPEFALIFLGDYIDRGLKQLNVLRTVLLLQFLFWGKVFMLRGNHEDFIYDEKGDRFLSTEKSWESDTFAGTWGKIFGNDFMKRINNFFEEMPLFLVYEPLKILMVHGGVPPFSDEGDDIFPYFNKLEDLSSPIQGKEVSYCPKNVLWSRVRDTDDVKFFKGQKSYEYAHKQVNAFLGKLGLSKMLRGHDPDMLKVMFDGKLVTFHTTGNKGNPYSAYPSILTPVYIKIRKNEIEAKKILSSNYRNLSDKELFAIIEALKS